MVNLREFFEREKTTIFYGLIAGFIASFFISDTQLSASGILRKEFTFALIGVSIVLAFLIKKIITGELFRIEYLKRSFFQNKWLLIILTVTSLYFIAPFTDLFAIKFGATSQIAAFAGAGPFGKIFLGIFLGIMAIPFPANIIIIGIIILLLAVFLGKSLFAIGSILSFVADNLVLLLIVGAILFVLYLIIGKKNG